MQNKYEIVEATLLHVAHLFLKMRKEDVQEIWAAGRHLPRNALIEGLLRSYAPKAGLYNNLPFCMFGVIRPTLLSRIGIPWMLASDDLNNHARTFLPQSKGYIKQIKTENTLLINYVDQRNKKAIKWLSWLGFEIGPTQSYGLDKLPFHVFFMVC